MDAVAVVAAGLASLRQELQINGLGGFGAQGMNAGGAISLPVQLHVALSLCLSVGLSDSRAFCLSLLSLCWASSVGFGRPLSSHTSSG